MKRAFGALRLGRFRGPLPPLRKRSSPEDIYQKEKYMWEKDKLERVAGIEPAP